MSPVAAGIISIAALFVLLATGMPIAFALGLSAIRCCFSAEAFRVSCAAETMFGGIANLAFVTVPMFVLMGAAVASSRRQGPL